MEIKRLLVINVPIKNCNLKCEYCYISALKENEKGAAKFLYTPEHVGKCLSKERLVRNFYESQKHYMIICTHPELLWEQMLKMPDW